MIERLNQTLDDEVASRVIELALQRYSIIAGSRVAAWWNAQVSDAVVTALQAFASDTDNASDVRKVAQLLSLVSEALDVVDETPVGDIYYPYTATTLVESCCKAIMNGATAAPLDGLWEGVTRFASHVDWQLRKSRIFVPESAFFAGREAQLWLRNARLTGQLDAEYVGYRDASVALAHLYLSAVDSALGPNSSAAYVVLCEAEEVDRLRRRLSEGVWDAGSAGDAVRWRTGGTSVYIGEWSPEASGFFESVDYVYLWSPSPTAAAAFIDANVEGRALVDPRDPTGMVLDRDGFVEKPVPTSPPWQ